MSQPNDQLDPQWRDALERLKTVPSRDSEAAARGRAHFLAHAKSLQQAVSQSAHRRHTGWINPFARQASLALSAVVFLLLCMLLGGTAATVYAAQDSLPDTPLYPVKIMSEEALTALAFQPEPKLDLLLSFADRRVNEIAALTLQGSAPPESVTSRLQQQLDEALELGAEMPDAGLTQALERVEATIQWQRQTLTRAQTHVAEPAKPVLARVQAMLEERLGLVEIGLTDPQTFRQQMHGLGRPSAPPGQEHRPAITPPGQQLGPTMIPPGQERRSTVTSPGQERRSTMTPSAQEHGPAITPPAKEPRPSSIPARRVPDAGKGD